MTLGDGPHGLGGATGDVFLCAGQTLSVAAGQHAVVESLGGALLQYRWSGLEDATTAASQRWWRWAAKIPGPSALRYGFAGPESGRWRAAAAGRR